MSGQWSLLCHSYPLRLNFNFVSTGDLFPSVKSLGLNKMFKAMCVPGYLHPNVRHTLGIMPALKMYHSGLSVGIISL